MGWNIEKSPADVLAQNGIGIWPKAGTAARAGKKCPARVGPSYSLEFQFSLVVSLYHLKIYFRWKHIYC